jgi:phage-related protein
MIWQGSVNMFQGVWNVIAGLFKAAWGLISGYVSGFVQGIIGFFTHLWDKLVGHSIIPDMINGIVSWFAGLPGKVFGFIGSFISGTIDRFRSFWNTIVTDAKNILGGIGNAVAVVFKGAVNILIGGINWVIDQIDKIHVSTPFGSVGFSIPHIPYLARGGTNLPGGPYWVGEQGRELVWLPGGSSVMSNSESESYASGLGSAFAVGGGSAGSGGGYTHASIILNVDGRALASVVGMQLASEVRRQGSVRNR